jgi:hypothetical protein
MDGPSTKIERVTVTNAYRFLYMKSGRTIAKDLNIGAFHCGIFLDAAADHVTVANTTHSVFWDVYAGFPFPSAPSQLSHWAADNGYGFITARVDQLVIENTLVLYRYAGILLGASTNQAPPRSGWGTVTDFMCDLCKFGIIANSTEPTGFQFANIQIVPHPTDGRSAVAHLAPPSGAPEPIVLINGGAIRSDYGAGWGWGIFSGTFPEGNLIVKNVMGVPESF